MITIPHLETDITQACQLSCVGCNHSVPLYRQRGPQSTTPQIVERDLAVLAPMLHTAAWGALGGEPTLSKHLVDILQVVRDSRIADTIEVWTNGLTAKTLKPSFWASLDRLVVSAYPGKLTDDDIDWIRLKCLDRGVDFRLMDERTRPNFQNMLDPEPSDATRTQRKFNSCFFKNFSRVVNDGFFFTCCCGPHLPVLMQGQPFGTDGIALEGLTEQALSDYLARSTPLGACTICAGRDGVAARPIAWSEERDPVAWVRKSQGL